MSPLRWTHALERSAGRDPPDGEYTLTIEATTTGRQTQSSRFYKFQASRHLQPEGLTWSASLDVTDARLAGVDLHDPWAAPGSTAIFTPARAESARMGSTAPRAAHHDDHAGVENQ